MGPACAERIEGPPPWRTGGRVGFTVDAVCVPDSSGDVLEVAVRVPPATILQLSRDAAGDAHLSAGARVKCRGGRALESTQLVTLAASDTVRDLGKVVMMRFPATPGPCQIEVRLTDQLSHRSGLLHPKGETAEFVSLTGTAMLPGAQAGGELSDIEFLWPVVGSVSSLSFVRGGRIGVPNPDRLYGLMASELRARFVARGKPDGAARPWHWVARVFDASGAGVAQRESTAAAGRTLDADVSFDLAREPAGAYDLEIKAWQDGDAGALHRRARFSIGWRAETWMRNAADVADDVHFLLSASEEDDFATTPPGEQERLLQAFWARRDPTSETAENEAYDTFRERVAHANEAFARFRGQKGMFTDMGRVYIRYGAPTEVLHQVMPAGDETLTQELQQIIDTEHRLPDGIHTTGPGGDMRPYEVWLYEGEIPLPLDIDPHEVSRGHAPRRLLFLFVDEQGTGLYRLRYSTE